MDVYTCLITIGAVMAELSISVLLRRLQILLSYPSLITAHPPVRTFDESDARCRNGSVALIRHILSADSRELVVCCRPTLFWYYDAKCDLTERIGTVKLVRAITLLGRFELDFSLSSRTRSNIGVLPIE